jgi:hypothetical protein
MRKYAIAISLVLGALLSGAACSSSRSAGSAAVSPQNELTLEQIRNSGGNDALEVVQRLRPLWLRTRSQSSINGPNTILVYMNETRLGGVEALRGYPLEAITKITYLTASEAANKLMGTGTTVVDGAIVLSTRKQ